MHLNSKIHIFCLFIIVLMSCSTQHKVQLPQIHLFRATSAVPHQAARVYVHLIILKVRLISLQLMSPFKGIHPRDVINIIDRSSPSNAGGQFPFRQFTRHGLNRRCSVQFWSLQDVAEHQVRC